MAVFVLFLGEDFWATTWPPDDRTALSFPADSGRPQIEAAILREQSVVARIGGEILPIALNSAIREIRAIRG
jgi:hypothetical protein